MFKGMIYDDTLSTQEPVLIPDEYLVIDAEFAQCWLPGRKKSRIPSHQDFFDDALA